MNFREIVTYYVWKVCFYVGVSLCRLCSFSVFNARAGFGMNSNHLFPQCVLANITLLGAVVGVGQDFISALCLSLPCQGWGLLPSFWSRSPTSKRMRSLHSQSTSVQPAAQGHFSSPTVPS